MTPFIRSDRESHVILSRALFCLSFLFCDAMSSHVPSAHPRFSLSLRVFRSGPEWLKSVSVRLLLPLKTCSYGCPHFWSDRAWVRAPTSSNSVLVGEMPRGAGRRSAAVGLRRAAPCLLMIEPLSRSSLSSREMAGVGWPARPPSSTTAETIGPSSSGLPPSTSCAAETQSHGSSAAHIKQCGGDGRPAMAEGGSGSFACLQGGPSEIVGADCRRLPGSPRS